MTTHIDDKLFKRYTEGDMEALQVLEAGLRQFSDNLIGPTGIGITDPIVRREIIDEVVLEVLERPARDLDTLVASLIVSAARRGVDYLRRGVDTEGTEGHIPPGVLVNLALVPYAMAAPALEAAERHLESCEPCRKHVDLIREATQRATTATSEVEAVAVTAPPMPPREVRVITDPKASRSPRSSQAGGRPPKITQRTRRHVDPRRSTGENEGGGLKLVLAIGAILLVGAAVAYAFSQKEEVVAAASANSRLPSLAVRAIPEVPPTAAWTEEARSGYQDLQAGKCDTAASHFRLARRRNPTDGLAWYYEGLSFVCAGDGYSAWQALDGAEKNPTPFTKDLAWYRAQAALLKDDKSLAVQWLKTTESSSAKFNDSAWELRRKVEKEP